MMTGPGGLEDLLAALEHRLAELGELGAAMVDDRHVHGAEHAIRHRARARNLQKMASLVLVMGSSLDFADQPILHSILIDSNPIIVYNYCSTAASASSMFRP